MVYPVSPQLYEETLARLLEAIASRDYFSGSVAFRFAQTECRLVASVIVYRRRESLPEGARDVVTDLVPVWWEFHTVGEEGEQSNDFSFSELKRFL